MKTALLTGLAAFALGATCATTLTGTGSAASVAVPAASRAPVDDSCTGPAASTPSCVVERVLTLDPASASPSATASRPAGVVADDDGTPDQGRGDRPAVAATAPAAPAPAPTAPAPTAVKLRGDGTVDDSQPGAAAVAGDDDGTPDQGRGDRPGRVGDDSVDDRSSDDDDDADRSGRRGGEDRSGSSDDDDRDDDRDDDSDDDNDDDSSTSGDDDGTADQGSGDR